ncbi:helix-turn-helix domain-containing protein [Nocardia sp. NPDC050630]|uniref:AraC-like ligand-binding domain-containing protein n=1 Tax=Nocardia sp. NPDC050630 TaxID=3364321 RepID=UPI0037ADB8B8
MKVFVAHGAEEWAHVISESFVPLSLAAAGESFQGTVRQSILQPGLTVTEVRTQGSSVVARTPRLTRTNPRDDFIFSLHLHGSGVVFQGERETPMPNGGGALYDAARPYRLVFPTDTWEVVLQVPREHLRHRFGRIEEICGLALPAEQPATRILATFLRELSAVAPDLTADQRAELGGTAVDLLTTALRTLADGRKAALVGRQALLAAMRAFVSENLTDPRLTPEVLARQHRISVRYMGELFAEADVSPAAYIRSERLRVAHRALTDFRQTHRTITSIASAVGFTDRTTFTRAFVRRYGVTPAELRGSGRAE